MSELKPCPFCGGVDLLYVDNGVYCKNTSCEGNIDFGHFLGGNDEESLLCKEAVAEAWNTRVDKEALIQEIEKLDYVYAACGNGDITCVELEDVINIIRGVK